MLMLFCANHNNHDHTHIYIAPLRGGFIIKQSASHGSLRPVFQHQTILVKFQWVSGLPRNEPPDTGEVGENGDWPPVYSSATVKQQRRKFVSIRRGGAILQCHQQCWTVESLLVAPPILVCSTPARCRSFILGALYESRHTGASIGAKPASRENVG